MWKKRKTTLRDEAFLLGDNKLHPKKKNYDLQQDLEKAGVSVHDLPVHKRLTLRRRVNSRETAEETISDDEKLTKLDKNIRSLSAEDWRKVSFTDDTHFLVQGQRSKFIRKAVNKSLSASHFSQTVKHPTRKMFVLGLLFILRNWHSYSNRRYDEQ
uniref:Uncharacterized protein n=1 Tax=Homalodisca liturata TaxID=320908 RepID=A0A1B6K5A8_9HEMI